MFSASLYYMCMYYYMYMYMYNHVYVHVYLHSGEGVGVMVCVSSKTAVEVVDGLQLSDVLEDH